MANKIEYGISNIHYAFVTNSATPAWEASPTAIPGATKLTLEDDSSDNPFYADNIRYVELGGVAGLSGTLDMAIFPDDFIAEALGCRIDSLGGFVEIAGATKKAFALGFQVEGDEAARRVWLYNCTLSRPGEEHNTTEDEIEPDTQSADFKAAPIAINDELVTRYSLPKTTENATAYAAFFESVVTPQA